MGRVLSGERRVAAITWWRLRFDHFLHEGHLTRRSLAATLLLDLNTLDASRMRRLRDAERALRDALAVSGEKVSDAVDEWIGRYVVDRSSHLLIDDGRRRAVLAAIRDADRRARAKKQPEPMVTLRVTQSVAKALRSFARVRGLPNDAAAISALIKLAPAPSRRNRGRSEPPEIRAHDLLGEIPEHTGATKPPARAQRTSPAKRGK